MSCQSLNDGRQLVAHLQQGGGEDPSQIVESPSIRSITAGSKTKKPPLIQPPSPELLKARHTGFHQLKRTITTRRLDSVTVAIRPWQVMVMRAEIPSEAAITICKTKDHRGGNLAHALRRPPVILDSPVSIV